MKPCVKCGATDRYRRSETDRHKLGDCRPCSLRNKHLRYHENPGRKREYNLRQNYGITAQDYDLMWLSQGGGCAICGVDCDSGKWMAVDHDHETGRVRGLLCRDHNTALGKFNDDPALLRAAADYIEKHRQLQAAPETDTQCLK